MVELDAGEVRKSIKNLHPTADFDVVFTFYYDETNNIKKFYVNEDNFNYSFASNFVLGGIAIENDIPDLNPLFDGLKLQKTIKEVKLKHIAKGTFLNCLESDKLNFFLKTLLDEDLYVHFSSINLLYYSLVDIVDSAIANSEVSMRLGLDFVLLLKNDLYKLAKLEIESVIELFYAYQYPNIKKESVLHFISDLTLLFEKYINTPEFHFGLESFRQILKQSKEENSLPFIMNGEDFILLKDFSQFYLQPVYLFKNSNHIFDNEAAIAALLNEFEFKDEDQIIKSFSFEDSTGNKFIQVSDVFIGLIGKFSTLINTNSPGEIYEQINNLTSTQGENLDLLIDLIDKSIERNPAFICSVDSFEELGKIELVRELRNKY